MNPVAGLKRSRASWGPKRTQPEHARSAAHRKATAAAIEALHKPAAESGYRRPALAWPQGEALYPSILAVSPLPQLALGTRGTHGVWLRPRAEPHQGMRVAVALAGHALGLTLLVLALPHAWSAPTSGALVALAFAGLVLVISFLVGLPLVKRLWSRARLPKIELRAEPVLSGAAVELCLHPRGATALAQLEVQIVCAEVISFFEGSTRREEEHEVLRLPAALTHSAEAGVVSAKVNIPHDAPPSFQSAHNALEWSVRIRARRPLAMEPPTRFVFRVLPRPRVAA